MSSPSPSPSRVESESEWSPSPSPSRVESEPSSAIRGSSPSRVEPVVRLEGGGPCSVIRS